jgi:hypothetical protein
MSVVATKAISAKLFVGTLELHSHLVDHTSEEIAADIISEVNKVMESYQARNPREPYGAPRFAFGRVESSSEKIDLYVMAPGTPNTQMGTVHLKWKKTSEVTEQLVIRKRVQQAAAMNAHFTLADLKTALSIRHVSLNNPKNDLLAHSLEYFEMLHRKYPTAITFDLELNDEGLTLIAYKDFQRHSVITAFTQQ